MCVHTSVDVCVGMVNCLLILILFFKSVERHCTKTSWRSRYVYLWFGEHRSWGGGCLCHAQSLSRIRLCDPMDCSLPGSSVHEILQARILDWVAIIPFSRGSSQPRDWTWVSSIAGRFFTVWATGRPKFRIGKHQFPNSQPPPPSLFHSWLSAVMVSLNPFIVISNMDIQVNTAGIEFSLHPGLPHEKLQLLKPVGFCFIICKMERSVPLTSQSLTNQRVSSHELSAWNTELNGCQLF